MTFSCKTLRIGSYQICPQFKVAISSGKIKFLVPSVKDQSKLVPIEIEYKDVIRILAHLGESAFIFLLLKSDACKAIREAVKMKRKKEVFLDVKSSEESQKRICIIPSYMGFEISSFFRESFTGLIQEIDHSLAFQIYNLSEPNVKHEYEKPSALQDVPTDSIVHTVDKEKDSQRKEMKNFNFSIAEIVKKYLSKYYKSKSPNKYIITSRAEYCELAKTFSHAFRAKISNDYFSKNSSFEGLKTTKSDEMEIKIQMETALLNRLKQTRPGS